MPKKKKSKVKVKIGQYIIVKFYWLIILLIFIGALVFEYFFLIKPKIQELSNGGELDIKIREEVIQEQEEYLDKLKELEKQAAKINLVELNKINYVLAEEISVPDVLKQIEILASQSGFELGNFDFEIGDGVLTLKLNFSGGSYARIKEYLGNIEKNIRIMDIKEIEVANIGKDLSIIVQSYYLEE